MNSLWAQDRPCPFATADAPHLAAAWDFSRTRLQRIVTALQTAPANPAVACVAVSGSLARMESHSRSDVDLLVVVDDRQQSLAADRLQQVYSDTWSLVDSALPEASPEPMAGGIFSECVSWVRLVDQRVRGQVDEAVTPYGQRMQLLLDAQPVWGHATFARLQQELFDWYADPPLIEEFEPSPFHWLTQEIHRYWRSIRARACWLFADQPDKAIRVNVKLRSSRLLLIATFLDAIRRDSQSGGRLTDRHDWLGRQCQLPPLERMAGHLPNRALRPLLSAYETAWLFTQQQSPSAGGVPAAVQQALQQLWHTIHTHCQLDM